MRSGRRGRGLNAPPPSFIWTRRIVLTLLTLFALVPVYVMVSFLNSLIVSASAAALSVAVAIFAAYAVSRYGFRGKRSSPWPCCRPRCSRGSCSRSHCS